MIFDTIAISELQKSPAKAFKTTRGVKWVLQNNRKTGAIIDPTFLRFLEEQYILEDFEDWLLLQDPEVKASFENAEKKLKSGDYSDLLTWDELCKSL